MTDPDQSNATQSLAEILLENNLISKAQIDLAIADQEINDIPLEEILLVRGWITEEKLYQVAPWLKPGSKQPAPPSKGTGSFAKPGGGKTGGFTKPNLAGAKPIEAQKPPDGGTSRASSGSGTSGRESSQATTNVGSGADSTRSSQGSSTDAAVAAHSASTSSGASSAAGSAGGNSSSGTSSSGTSSSGTASSGTTGKPASKPSDIPKEPPLRSADTPSVITSPVKSDSEQNLKAYKDVLKKILALEKD